MDIGPTELIIILVIVILVFGVGRLGKIGGELGGAIRQFRQGLNGDQGQPTTEAAAGPEVRAATTMPAEPTAAPTAVTSDANNA